MCDMNFKCNYTANISKKLLNKQTHSENLRAVVELHHYVFNSFSQRPKNGICACFRVLVQH